MSLSWAQRIAHAFEAVALGKVTPRVVARERLSIILAHQRLSDVNIQQLQADVLTCVQKYIPLSPEQLSIKVKNDGGIDVFEMQIALAGRGGGGLDASSSSRK